MVTPTRTLQTKNWLIYAGLLLALLALLVLSPAEATLGNVVKIVYAHGAAERIAAYAYVVAGVLGIVALSLRAKRGNPQSTEEIASSPNASRLLAMTEQWAQAIAETAIVFWIAQFVISAPAQVLAWGAFDFREPRVASALWILVLTALVYIVARWIGEKNWMSLAAVANLAIFLIVLRGAVNILHPGNAIIASDSLAIKAFYAAIVLTMGLLAVQFASDRARSEKGL